MRLRFIRQFLQSGLDCSFLIVFLFIHGSRSHKNTTWRRCFHKNTREHIEFQMWKMLNDHDGRTNDHEKKILVRQQEGRKTTCSLQQMFQVGCGQIWNFISGSKMQCWNIKRIGWNPVINHQRTSFIVKFRIVQTLQRTFTTFHVQCVEKEPTNPTDRIWLHFVGFTMKRSTHKTREKISKIYLKLSKIYL